ncbi:glycoside hydrolase family 2 protein [Phyllobacterium sp. 628]|uniref:beta-mannosidase n=1 Tax=Phyllobacterium sp. 628 TaxID=2718938 RepID=UPI0035303C6F
MAGAAPLPVDSGRLLDDGWQLILTASGEAALPDNLHRERMLLNVPVPGTVAAALEQANQFERGAPTPLNQQDAWYLRSFQDELPGLATLHFEGLATIAEVYWNGARILATDNMFLAFDAPVQLSGNDELAICFRALAPHLDRKGPRARWRTQLMNNQGLRLVRTTALGYMPGWCPEIHAAGPWRPVRLLRPDPEQISNITIASALTDKGEGILTVHFDYSGTCEALVVECAHAKIAPVQTNNGCWQARLVIPDIAVWWPHTHGSPVLHDVTLHLGKQQFALGRTGFRSLRIDHDDDGQGFAVIVNGKRIFCRGTVWSSADIVRLPGNREDYAPWLHLAVEAGMNMIRVSGITVYESNAFFDLCDELGILIWQDFMFANFDYPAKDANFAANVDAEARQFLTRTMAAPSLAILCGGSEIYQQGSMLGLPETVWKGPLTEEILSALSASLRPDVPYVANSPCGGALPFISNAGVSHYYGVSAYCRPLDDARRANVRFATECLAFSNVPEARTLKAHLNVPAVHDPRWKARVPRDNGVSWDFEDVREAYLEMLYGFDPARLRREDNETYLHLSRAVTAEVMETTFAEWRRPGSTCSGGLVWMLQDLLSGAGWGVIDSTGEPKAAWYGLKRASRPVNLTLTDEGINGLALHIINERQNSLNAIVQISCLRGGKQPVVSGRHELTVGQDERITLAATDVFGAFFDTTYAYRFGPPSHDVTIARLKEAGTGRLLAEAFHFPQGRTRAFHDAVIEPTLTEADGHWLLDLATPVVAQSVHVDVEGYRPDDNWFHLAPGETKRVRLVPHPGIEGSPRPSGEIRIAGSSRVVWFE